MKGEMCSEHALMVDSGQVVGLFAHGPCLNGYLNILAECSDKKSCNEQNIRQLIQPIAQQGVFCDVFLQNPSHAWPMCVPAIHLRSFDILRASLKIKQQTIEAHGKFIDRGRTTLLTS